MYQTQHKPAPGFDDGDRMRQDIAYLESRLAEIGHDGDCAYEKAMVRFYHDRVATLRQRLAQLTES